jgi:hypothetical protein
MGSKNATKTGIDHLQIKGTVGNVKIGGSLNKNCYS